MDRRLIAWDWSLHSIPNVLSINGTWLLSQGLVRTWFIKYIRPTIISWYCWIVLCKVHIFWEGHKILRNLHRRFVLCSNGQIYGGDFAKFCGLLRIYELYTEEKLVGILLPDKIRLKVTLHWLQETFLYICPMLSISLGIKTNQRPLLHRNPTKYVAVLFFVCRYLMVKKNVLLLWANKVKQIISGRHDVYIVLLYQLFFCKKEREKAP